ncbi:hypothetical protein OXX80_001275 [Metschnikowia pulcherrima]
MWLVKVLSGLKSILIRTHPVLTDCPLNVPISESDHATQESGQENSKDIMKVSGKVKYSLHPPISRFTWQISGSTTICVPVDFERF